MKTVSLLILRLSIQFDLKFPDFIRCCQAHRHSPVLSSFTNSPEARALPSIGITRLPRYIWPFPTPRWSAALSGDVRGSRFPRPSRASPTDARLPFWRAVLTTPVDPMGARRLSLWRAPAPGSSPSVPPSPVFGRVGVHIAAFEACSSFTRVTARQIARPPCVDFVARFRSARLPAPTARQLSNLTINCSCGSFPHW